MFSEKYLEMLIQVLQYLTPDYLQCDRIIREVLEEGRASFHENLSRMEGKELKKKQTEGQQYAMIFMFWWQLFMFIILMSFLLSCISQFAQYHQMTIDNDEIQKLRQKLNITTPMRSGTVTPMSTVSSAIIQGNSSGINSISSGLGSNGMLRTSVVRHHYSLMTSPTCQSPYSTVHNISSSISTPLAISQEAQPKVLNKTATSVDGNNHNPNFEAKKRE